MSKSSSSMSTKNTKDFAKKQRKSSNKKFKSKKLKQSRAEGRFPKLPQKFSSPLLTPKSWTVLALSTIVAVPALNNRAKVSLLRKMLESLEIYRRHHSSTNPKIHRLTTRPQTKFILIVGIVRTSTIWISMGQIICRQGTQWTRMTVAIVTCTISRCY